MVSRIPVFPPFALLEREHVEYRIVWIHCVGDEVGAESFAYHRLQGLPFLAGPLTEKIVLALRDDRLHKWHGLLIMMYCT